jgi:murein L,D-transpeptidase YafK
MALAGGLLSLAACARPGVYNGPEVTNVIVKKDRRKMYLMHHGKVLRDYRVQLGFTPTGHKIHAGDGCTPEGRYWIDRRNPNSAFHLSVGISYPNDRDAAYAAALGKHPGGDIFIHGWGDEPRGHREDWTAGCVAVTNQEMESVYAMVNKGTVVDIFA